MSKRKAEKTAGAAATAAAEMLVPAAGNMGPGGKVRGWWWGLLCVALLLAGWVRLWDLGHAAVRSDEINFYNYVAAGRGVVDLWVNPPWLEHIPLADSIPVVWFRSTGLPLDEGTLRIPFALLGWGAVCLGGLWLMRRRRPGAAVLFALWLGLLPFHVYHSREAYYYGLAMFAACGMGCSGIDLLLALKKTGKNPGAGAWIRWGIWTGLACICHSTVWPVAAATGLAVAWGGCVLKDREERRRFWTAWGGVVVLLGIWMSRWVYRAVLKVLQDFGGDKPLIGNSLGWLLARMGGLSLGGINTVGVLLWIMLVAMAWFVWRRSRGQGREGIAGDLLYGTVCLMMGVSVGASLLYVAAIGRGTAKWVYFAAPLPLLLAWAAMTVERFWAGFGARARRWGMAATAAGLAAVLAWPAWEVTRVEGKPTPYHALRAWLDGNLAEGDVAIVDRWLEPWNEMALYAPEKVDVGFTVPDEPYEQYVANDWRGVTKRFFEQNGAQAFIRLSRNHADRMGVWTWPEKWFAHRSVVTNAAGLKLAKTGFAPMEEFYLNPSRVEVEIFWDTHEEAAAKQFARGAAAAVFFGGGWRLFKPWQQGDFRDYRLLGDGPGQIEIWRPADAPSAPCRIAVTATAAGGETTVRAGRHGLMRFRPGETSTQVFGETLGPGRNVLEFHPVQGPGTLAVLDVGIEVP